MNRSAAGTMLLLAALGCDRAKAPPAQPAPPAPPPVAPPPEQPPRVEPRAPDFEDARGTVRGLDGSWIIEVEGGARPLCLPFEAPAEARVDGIAIRFTAYLADNVPTGCRPVETLISLRTVDVEPGSP